MHSVLLELNLFFLFEVFANFPSVRDYSCYFKGKVIYFLIIKHHIPLKVHCQYIVNTRLVGATGA